jgi:hypothetical protein
VRDVYDHAVSAWKQNVKNSGDTCDLAGFVETADQADMLQFQRLAPLLVAGLDLRVINYDHHKQSLVPRFLNEIGLSAGDGRLQELASPRKNLSLSYWQAQTVVLSHRITGLSRLTALAVNRLRQQSDGRADPYLREVDDLLLDAQRPLIQSLNRLLPRDQQLRDQPRADHGDAQVTFAEADMAALLQIFRDYAAMPSAQDAPSRQEGLPEDFDPEEYLLRYPDVAAAGMDAATHYLNHGQFEGRVYKVPAGP